MSKPAPIGQTLGQYRIEEVLGQGGMGVVYRAVDTHLNRPVAMKFLSNEVADSEARRRFQREAQLASSLSHPHIVTVLDAGDWHGQQYVVTEFVNGGTLDRWVATEPRSWRQCLDLLMGVAEGLAAAHEAGILHRDIKPSNILVSQNGYAKLADFGLAKLEASSPSDETRTLTGVILGTTAYMSPEQATGGKCDFRSDIFSFGIVLYEVLSGRRAFEGKSPSEIVQKIIAQQPLPLDDSIPSALRNVVEKALEKEPADRYQAMREMVVDLRRAGRRSEPIRDAVSTPATPETAPRRWRIPAAALVTAATVIALLFRPDAPPLERPKPYQLAPPPGVEFVVSAGAIGGFAVSPDGQTLAFVASVSNSVDWSLWVKPLYGDGVARRVEGSSGVQNPFWSPDSKTIGYFASGGMYLVEAAGGTPTLIHKSDSAGVQKAGTWLEDGNILFMEGGSGLLLLPAAVAGAEPKQLIPDPAMAFPQTLSGGAFLYWKGGGGSGQGIYAATLADPLKGKLLVSAPGAGVYASGHLLWREENKLVARPLDVASLKFSGEQQSLLESVSAGPFGQPTLTASTTGTLIYDTENTNKQLTMYSRLGQPVRAVGVPRSYQSVRLFDNGRRVMLLANAQHDEGLWLINDRDLPNKAISTPMRNPVPTADGKSVVFGSQDIGIVRSDLTGENRDVIKASGALEFPTDISGDVLLFNVYSNEMKNDIWSLRVLPDGRPVPGAEPVLYLQTPASETPGRFARGQNQKWLAYTSNKTGRHEVYMQSYPKKGEDIPISDAGGSHPVWGPGGRELFYLGLDHKLMAVEVKYGANSVSPSKPQPLFTLTLGSVVPLPPYDTVDGERFLVLVPVAPANRPLQAIDNWTLLLEKR